MNESRWNCGAPKRSAKLCRADPRRVEHDSIQQSSKAGVLPNWIEPRITREPNKLRFLHLVCDGKEGDRAISIAQRRVKGKPGGIYLSANSERRDLESPAILPAASVSVHAAMTSATPLMITG